MLLLICVLSLLAVGYAVSAEQREFDGAMRDAAKQARLENPDLFREPPMF